MWWQRLCTSAVINPAGATNEGVLLDPIWQDATLDWRYSENDPRLEDGRLSTWQVLVIDGSQRDELLYLSRQVVTALGRESERMGRSFISNQPLSAEVRDKIALEHAGLAFAVTPTDTLLAELVTRGADPAIQSAGAIVWLTRWATSFWFTTNTPENN